LESASLCNASCLSLAIPETAVLKIAETLHGEIKLSNHTVFPESGDECEPSCLDVIRGILPSLQYIVERDSRSMESILTPKAVLPDADPLMKGRASNPFSNDFVCQICSCEISNLYFRCQGCWTNLRMNFKICSDCFVQEAYLVNIFMGRSNARSLPVSTSHEYHFGSPQDQCCCPSTSCLQCIYCEKCLFGMCICHKSFQMRFRFYSVEDQQKFLKECDKAIKGNDVKYSVETFHRLQGKKMESILLVD
jgi:hypothetical protein